MTKYRGTILIAVTLEAESAADALLKLHDNPLAFESEDNGITITSENHDVVPLEGK